MGSPPTDQPDDWPLHDLRVGDRVILTDGREGKVIGFYRGEPELALVLLDSGVEVTVPATNPQPVL